LIVLALILILAVVAFSPPAQRWVYYKALRAGQFLVMNTSEFRDDVTVTGDLTVTGAIGQTGDQTITGDFTVTGNTALGDAAGDTVTVTGDQTIAGLRDGTSGYDYFSTISGEATGVITGAKTYGQLIELERSSTYPILLTGDLDDAGLKVRVETEATSTTAGTTLRGADVEAKADNPSGTVSNLYGGSFTAKSDTGAGSVATMIALQANAQNNAAVTTDLIGADIRIMRQAATHPTNEMILQLRNGSTTGSGADAAIEIYSNGTGGSDDFGYGIDMATADVDTADIRLSQGETIDNTTDGTIAFGGIIAPTGDISLENGELISNDTDGTIDIEGNFSVAGVRDASTGYDYFVTVAGEATGVVTGAKTIGLLIDMERSSSYPITPSGDLADTGLQVRVETEATSTIAGTVLRAVDAEAKADNPDGTVSNLFGGSFTAKSDTGAGSVDSMIGLQSNVQNNAAVATTLISADFRLYRQAATVPTTEYVTRIRSSSSTGSGADAAIYVESDYAGSATTDSFDYGLDMNAAAINTADIRLENGETINNNTDTAVQIGGFLALTEGTVIDLANGATITPTASYQPLTCSGAEHSTTSDSTAIADGPVAGSLLILCNEDATYNVVIKDAANTKIGGDKTLTANQDDCISLIWNGADWVGLSDMDN